ncbi:G-protein coupled receptor 84-like [Patiria miniata]|uniref:G-protein coupled receptors family 1 profile domain-containing protein n=1 Tax=Patiria miniata TaxID=46514 RepID=A0A913ZRX4_PATMI|nr:G-protein coupled receptor 84-like [Patiria miniata]
MEGADSTNTTRTQSEVYMHIPGRGECIFLVAFFILVMIVGSFGNCLTLCVYCSKSLKSSTHVLIIALSVADLIVCLLRPYEIAWYSSSLTEDPIPRLIFDGFNCLDRTFIATSFMATGVIALDRYDCVCRPIHRKIMTSSRAKRALLAILAASVVGNTPLYLQTSLTENPPLLNFIIYISVFVLFLASLATITVCYSKVFLTIRRHVKTSPELYGMRQVCSTRQHATVEDASLSNKPPFDIGLGPAPEIQTVGLSSRCPGNYPGRWANARGCGAGETTARHQFIIPNGRRRAPAPVLQRKTTTMLFVTSVVFLVVWLPYGINAIMDAFDEKSVFMKVLSNILYLNNAINPFIYGLANRRFRKECKDVLSRMRLY